MIEFQDSNLRPLGRIADLVVSHHGRTRPSRHYVRMNVPDHYVPSLAGRNQATNHEPSVLCLVASVEQHREPLSEVIVTRVRGSSGASTIRWPVAKGSGCTVPSASFCMGPWGCLGKTPDASSRTKDFPK